LTAPSPELVRRLAGFADGGPVVSLYLDVDGRRHVRPADYEVAFERMARPCIDRSAQDAVKQLHKIRHWVQAGFDRSHVRGVAVFAGPGLWETVELPVPVRNQLVVNETPHVGQLEAVLDNHERIGVLLADRQRARVFVLELGQLVDKTELFDRLPRHEDDKGDRRRDQIHDHQDAVAQHHLRRAAAAAFEAFQDRGFDHFVIGAPEEMAGELERTLHAYLRERLVARISVPVAAHEDDVRVAVEEVEGRVERDRKAALVDQVRAGKGVGGLEPVLAAIAERRVATLLVSDGFLAPGWRCDGCAHLAPKGRRCPACGAEMAAVDDVVEEAIEAALLQSARVEVCGDNADLDVLGRVAAVLRY
jgi:peptide subunit release factor 1 (eRF1)